MQELKAILIIGLLIIITLILCWTSGNTYTPPERFCAEWEIVESPAKYIENDCIISEAQINNTKVSGAYLIQRENAIREKLGKNYGKVAI